MYSWPSRPEEFRAAVRALTIAAAVLCLGALASAQRLPAEPAFQVASIKPNTSDAPPASRFPLGPGDAYIAGTTFAATSQPLIAYIRFAFGRSQGELLRLPSWVYDERFDIQGRSVGEPTKDDMRLMVRALLAERFKLAWHFEKHEEPVLELVLAKPSELGPQLTRHGGDQPCEQGASSHRDPKFDAIPCGSAGLVTAGTPGRGRISGRAEPIARLATLLSNNSFADVNRIVLDHTGLAGDFDFTVEWAMVDPAASPSRPATHDAGPPLAVALRQQLGLTLRAAKAPIDVLVIDHVERPSGN